VHEPAPASGVIVDEVHVSENKVPFFLSICLVAPETDLLQNDDASVPPEKVADKSVSGTGCSDGVDPTEP